MLNVIPFFIFNDSFLLCFLLNTCWWDQTVISQGCSQSSVHVFLKKTKQRLLFFHILLHKSQWWRSLCCLCLFNMIVWKRAKQSQLRFWMNSRYPLIFSASKSHPSYPILGFSRPNDLSSFPLGMFSLRLPLWLHVETSKSTFPLGYMEISSL